MMTKILEQTPTERKPRIVDDFEPISAILPEVLNHIVQAAANAQQHPTPEQRSVLLRLAA